jgi:hypothetical protein
MTIELINNSFLTGISAGLGITPILKLRDVKTDVKSDLALLDDHGGPIPFITCSSTPGFYQKAICGVTHSFAQHSGIFIGKRFGDLMRIKHPDILKPHDLPGDEWQGKILPGCPEKAMDYEVIESQITINTNTMKNIVREGEQVIAFVRDWTDSEVDAILYSAYMRFGAPYDILEIGNYVWGWIPNPHFLKVCSTFVESAIEKGDSEIREWIISHNGDPEKCSPADVGKYFFSNILYKPVSFNCAIEEAKDKI